MSFDPFKRFGVDKQKEVEGVWFPLDKNARILIARRNNPKYQEYIREHLSHLRVIGAQRVNSNDDDLVDSVVLDAYARTIILDWEGFTVDGGKSYPYSIENARELLEIADFREVVFALSQDLSAFQSEVEEEDLGNLKSSSAGKSSGASTKNS